ncbi:hypothetical protein L596_010194 [Steinernema carpocapsae]|uniref:Uncharacterized protein n=1 Tax=Steinernema carpocapsae TaxID=34508 RepID=A0A4U5PID1_STECR|nr:hypothetical protein L596_010194 [Steinernema carpocapsae]
MFACVNKRKQENTCIKLNTGVNVEKIVSEERSQVKKMLVPAQPSDNSIQGLMKGAYILSDNDKNGRNKFDSVEEVHGFGLRVEERLP